MPRWNPKQINEWHTRSSEYDPDVITICPVHPDLMITGTYQLVKATERQIFPGQFRQGSIYVNLVSPTWRPAFPGQQTPKLAKRKLPAAILDIHFHPLDGTLLGVALSDMTIHFFRFVKRADILSRRILTELLSLGSIEVASRDEDGLLVLCTQFRWLDMYEECGNPKKYTNTITTHMVVSLSTGEIITVKVKLPGVRSTFDPRLAHKPGPISFSRESVHWHTEEAWTVITIPISSTVTSQTSLLLSGGDDSKLIAAMVQFDTTTHAEEHNQTSPQALWTDSKTHTGGVTAIHPLPPPLTNDPAPPPILILTGSYDEHLRLFTLSPHTFRRQPLQPIAEAHLLGGVWRIKLMDNYIIPLQPIPPEMALNPDNTTESAQKINSNGKKRPLPPHETHYILLVATMHASVQIVRLVHTPFPTEEGENWSMTVLARLKPDAHNSVVYGADARKEWPQSKYNLEGVAARDEGDGHLHEHLEELRLKRLVRQVGVDVAWADQSKETRPSWKSWSEELRGEVRTAWEKEQWERSVGRYTCLSISFYDRKICTWVWRDEKRKEGIELQEFLERY
ncbi:uncharacterized protein HMPREF1541_07520 [Cyphellophora europaea CBS 101466]|uniref:Uncharacterized protein n=1 Tax=Cyphellophora europaea (strain CBS 101466) TaxID=1220924 RepID=W2RN77_CYPE1|nr:uncharacterized protein HMPREF1541_07520 [Cyphellophora europaea CBS 101466]ETN37897.1 hypothetical protein HMPREF1541_07520 [Cyphellophora europaea CBS 101466]